MVTVTAPSERKSTNGKVGEGQRQPKPTLVEQQREKRRAIEAAIQQNPGMSDNAIADMLGVHNQTVTKVRRGVKHTDDNRSVRIPEGKTLSVACVRR